MNKLLETGRVIFSIGIIALAILCFISKDFIVGRPPAWPAGFQPNPALAYVSGALMLVAAIAILIQVKAGQAALLIAGLIFGLSVLRHFPNFGNDWVNALKSLALAGGALIVAASFLRRNDLGINGCLLLAAFFIGSGIAHFKYAGFVENFIPAYIPFHSFWTYFCGICMVAGGIGIIIGGTRKWAALLSGIMLSGWFLLLHIPRFLANTNDVSDRLGLAESFTFAGIFFVLAGIKKEVPVKQPL
jgi:uncharacterized membrane protein YphA (DoxX/SURF4 family)